MRNIRTFFVQYWPLFILLIGLLFGSYRLVYFSHSNVPLGYDPGIYKAIFTEYLKIFPFFDLSLLPSWVRHEPLLSILAVFGNKLGISFDWLLTWGIGIASLLPGLVLYFVLRKKNPTVGVIAAILYRLSMTQYQLFWWNYFKQIIAISLMLIIIYLLQNKKNIWFAILLFLLFALHRHTALYTSVIVFFYTLVTSIKEKKIPRKIIGLVFFVSIGVALIYLPYRHRLVSEGLKLAQSTSGGTGYGGDFITKAQYVYISFLTITISIVGYFIKYSRKERDTYFWGYVVGIIWIGFGLVNFNRTLPFMDIFVIILAAYALGEFIKKYKKFGVGLILIVFAYLGFQFISYVDDHSVPLISEKEFDAIKSFDKITEPNAIVINTHKNYSPWVMGYSNRDYINPGMSDLDMRDKNRRMWWRTHDGKTKCDMLRDYNGLNRPIYMRICGNQFLENFDWQYCLSLVKTGQTYQIYKIKNLK